MDFLDPQKMRQHNIMLFIGYALIGVAIVIATLILLYQSYGFGFGKNGEVIQNGLVFTASTPNGGDIYIDGKDSTYNTRKRLVLPEGHYDIQIRRDGYRWWSRTIAVEGGSVNRYDYPFLFPEKLETRLVKNYDAAPALASQSPDRRWVLAQTGSTLGTFDVYDLQNYQEQPTQITLPKGILTAANTSESWQLVEWSNDNRHVLLRHNVDTSYEFILLDREDPTQSVNLTQHFTILPTEMYLVDKKYDHYYLFDQAAKTLQTANLSETTPLDYLKNVLAFKSYGNDTMLYVTDDTKAKDSAVSTDVAVKLAQGDQTYTIRKLPANTAYTLEITKYSGDLFVAAGATATNAVFVYKNPVSQITSQELGVAVPVATLRVNAPSYVSFSDNARFIMAENGSDFAVYDAETKKPYDYTIHEPLDGPQQHATWMDGHRLEYVSNGALVVFDFDHSNYQKLMAMNAGYEPFYTPDYRQVFAFDTAGETPTQLRMSATWLRTKADR